MYKALIADDEKKVCQLIETLGDWARLGIEVVDVCADGETAMESILAHRPDIVVTDIRMPVYSGLEIVEKSQSNGLDIAFVIVSGYRQFEYAHRALKFGIADYLLKPIDQKQLNTVLERVCAQLDEKRERKDHIERAEHILLQNHRRLQASFVQDGVADAGVFALPGDEIARRYGLSFPHDEFYALVLRVQNAGLIDDNSLFGNKVDDIAQQVFADYALALVAPCRQCIYAVLNCRAMTGEMLKSLCKTFYYEVKMLENIYGAFRPTLGVSDRAGSPCDLRRAFGQADLAERCKLYVHSPQIIYFPGLPPRPAAARVRVDAKKLGRAIEVMDAAAADEWFEAWSDAVESLELPLADEVYRLRDEVLEQIGEAMSRAEIPPDARALDELRFATDSAESRRALAGTLHAFVRDTIAGRLAEQAGRASRPIMRARQYIERHFAQPLTLEVLANEVGFAPNYFSTAFKEQTGQSFTEYLTDVRMERAKELLRTTNRTVQDIVEAVGYADEKHFRKLFKKSVGTTPKEYRRLYAQ